MAEKVRDHLANERTYLAWVRTALGLIGLGFVLARMGLFLRQIALTASAEGLAGVGAAAGARIGQGLHNGQEFLVTGVVFLVIGTTIGGWSGWHYDRNRRAIDSDRFEAALRPVIALTAVVALGGLVIIGLLIWRMLASEA
jgi:putative membrane protein